MSKYLCEVTSRSIAFEVSHDDYLAIEDRDTLRNDESSERGDEWDYNKIFLSGILNTIEGVDDADYNGHFGPYVFFTIDAKHDSHTKRDQIASMIMDYIKGQGEFA